MSVYTRTQLTTDHGPRVPEQKPNIIVLHHGALFSLSSLLGLMMPGGRTVSAHAAIADKEIVKVVPSARRAYSLGSQSFDSRAMSTECVNNSGAPGWTLSDETHESIAQWVAEHCREFGIIPNRSGPQKSWTVIGHREVYTIWGASYATACPGGMRMGWIVNRAKQLLEPKPQPKKEEVMAKNFVNIDTYKVKPGSTNADGGGAGVGTKCLTLWEGGKVELYDRSPADPHEFAKDMFEAYGAHVEVNTATFDRLAKSAITSSAGTTINAELAPTNALLQKIVTVLERIFK